TIEGVFASECGFEPYERDDGLWPDAVNPRELAYNRYLRQQGYNVDNPWHDFANAGRGEEGELLSGWLLRHARTAAAVKEEHSETAYMTNRAMDFIAEAGDTPWCLHLSYIKPHWPYIAPAPYHAMYGAADVQPANRVPAERDRPHPVVAAFMAHEESRNFAREEVRAAVIPAYMGLIKQLDDHFGRLLRFLEARGLMETTLIVFTSDHGDYLGDHWLGEKELFHEESVRIPLIIVDPRPEADATRGTVCDRLTESIDLIPTFVDLLGGPAKPHLLEGRSLRPLLEGRKIDGWREFVVSEVDYAWRGARLALNLPPDRTRGYMLLDGRWKYISYDNFRPQLFDLKDDPNELHDLGESVAHGKICRAMEDRLNGWLRARRNRTTMSHEEIEARTNNYKTRGIYFGVW